MLAGGAHGARCRRHHAGAGGAAAGAAADGRGHARRSRSVDEVGAGRHGLRAARVRPPDRRRRPCAGADRRGLHLVRAVGPRDGRPDAALLRQGAVGAHGGAGDRRARSRRAGPGVTVVGAKELTAIVQAKMPQLAPKKGAGCADAAGRHHPGAERGGDDRGRARRGWRRCAARGARWSSSTAAAATAPARRAAPLADRVIAAPRGRALQMNAGARAEAAPAPTCCCSCTPTRGCRTTPTAIVLRALASSAALLGPLRRAARRRRGRRCGWSSAMMNLALARDRHRHRRPGDLRRRAARSSALGGFAAAAADGGHRVLPPRQAAVAAAGAARRAWRPRRGAGSATASGAPSLLMWRLRLAYFLGADPGATGAAVIAMPAEARRRAIAVFARAPVPGQAKTRLIPALGARGRRRAAAAADRAHAGRRPAPCRRRQVHAVGAPATSAHPFVVRRAPALRRRRRRAGRRRPRRAHAPRLRRRRRRRCVLIGTDCPQLAPTDLQRAAAALAEPRRS
ncbi:MAG: hypothetical protein MZW92_06155 [Comamonadaceae bacterium]|nr:hypothetical protein [Comamonadaceae bacterium]